MGALVVQPDSARTSSPSVREGIIRRRAAIAISPERARALTMLFGGRFDDLVLDRSSLLPDSAFLFLLARPMAVAQALVLLPRALIPRVLVLTLLVIAPGLIQVALLILILSAALALSSHLVRLFAAEHDVFLRVST